MTSSDQRAVKKVEDRYGEFANQAMAGELLPVNVDGMAPKIGDDSDLLAERLYTDAELSGLPAESVSASIGCGNPLAMIDVEPGSHILDLGSGGGIDCFMAARAVGRDGWVIGVDATPSMIELANRNKEKMGVANVEFRLGRIESLPVEDRSIDLIVSNCVIDISADKASVFREAIRVLKPGGQIAISDTVLKGEIPIGIKANIDIWAGATITPLAPLRVYLDLMHAAGFVDVEVRSLTSYGLENFEELDEQSQVILTKGVQWTPLPPNTGLYSASIFARKRSD